MIPSAINKEVAESYRLPVKTARMVIKSINAARHTDSEKAEAETKSNIKGIAIISAALGLM